MFRLSRFLLLACAAGYMACAAPVLAADTLMMATTTSTQDSGLLEYLEPVFKQETGIELKWVAVGTGKALEIAKNCDATIISTAEICGLAQEAGCKAHAMHLGGTFKFPFGKVRLTLAFHGSGVPGGHACGIVIDFYGTKLYFAGDTALFSDMQLLPKLDAFEYAVLPIGGNFTMDPNDALIACKLLQAKYVIPVHYNTWPPIAQDVEAFKAAVEDETDSKVLIVKPGNTIDID